jgi:hypothetical protein
MMTFLKKTLLPLLLLVSVLLAIIYIPTQKTDFISKSLVPDEEESVKDKAENAQGRIDHFIRLTQDPATKRIPANIRAKELAFAKNLESNFKSKSLQAMVDIDITEAGPNDVGGRTRALGIDPRNSNIILAGGASGGMWKSTDGGSSWIQTSDLGENLGVTSLVQDPDNLDTWYYSTGEFSGASSRARGGGGQLYGSGIYVSNDNGDSWSQIPTTNDNDVSFNSQYDYISRVEISPTTGTKFFSSNALGVYRSSNNFVTNSFVLGGSNQHIYSDVQVAGDGTVIAAISRAFNGTTPTNDPGVYVSTDDGLNWVNVTPNSYPSSPGRAVIGISESDPSVFFVFVANNINQPSLFRFDISDLNNVNVLDRTDNIPDFGGSVGTLNLQGGYNMVCEIHPTNKNIVVVGGTNLYRSTNGFATKPTDQDNNGFTDSTEGDKYWIGGYAPSNDVSQYSNHHPDQHAAVFDPNNPDRLFSSHDGGISVTSNVSAAAISWQSLNNGYNVTQFYTVTLHPGAADSRILGGTQDNGSPFFEFSNANGTSISFDISSGDGAYSYLGDSYLTTSSQNGRLIQYQYNGLGEPTQFSYIAPLSASNTLFIHPYVVNHTNEDFIFYPGGNQLFRNNSATTLPRNATNPNGTNQGWSNLTEFASPPGTIISTLAISTANPSDVLYYAAYSGNSTPKIFKVTNSSTATTATDFNDISITSVNSNVTPPEGAYIHDISVSEDNGNEIIAVVSNYSTESIYYSSNGGNSWTGVGGNLETPLGNGPSVRSAAITKNDNGEKNYFVGTSTGLYATDNLDGNNTEWKLQGSSTIGNTVVEYLDYRTADKTLGIATHGRGIFLGNASMSVSNEENDFANLPSRFELKQNYPNPFNPSTNISYSLPATSNVSITVYDINGRKVADLLSSSSQTAGQHNVSFDAGNLASGVYLYKINAISADQRNSFSEIKRMTLIK